MLVTTVSAQVAGKVAQVTMFLAQVRKNGNDLRHGKNAKG